MKLNKSLRLAFNILVHSKVRSWLSIIGIVIGVASVISILALGEGMTQDMEERLGSLGADLITVSKGNSRAFGPGGGFDRGGGDFGSSGISNEQENLTNKDVQALKIISNIDYIQGVVSGSADLDYLSESITVTVKGVDPKVWKEIETTDLDSGRYLSQGDTNVVVISYALANNRFKEDIQLNRQVTIEGKVFRVVGILEESSSGGGMGGAGSSASVYMPIDIARDTLEDVGDKEFNSIEIKVKDVNLIDDTLDQIEKRLMLVRAVTERTKDFSVSSVKEMQETISETLSSMTLFLGAIAAISLLVGAVGIANTMFTTVLEKTKEIGVMKSIGAKNKDIMLIFLFNSGMIGLAGGLLGGILGVIISSIMVNLIGNNLGMMLRGTTSIVATPEIVAMVFGVSVATGIIAGIIPAYRASKMNPVDALRYE